MLKRLDADEMVTSLQTMIVEYANGNAFVAQVRAGQSGWFFFFFCFVLFCWGSIWVARVVSCFQGKRVNMETWSGGG